MWSAFKESDRLRRVFNAAAGGSFSIIYRAMRECASEANGELLREQDVLNKIAVARAEREQ